MVSCYQTLRTPVPNPNAQVMTVLALGKVIAYAFDGAISYWEPSDGHLSATPGVGLQLQTGKPFQRQSPVGTWLIVLTPLYGESKKAPNPQHLLTEAATHCALLYGRVMLHRRLAQMIVETDDIRRAEIHAVKLIGGPYVAFGSYTEAQPPLITLAAEFEPYKRGFEQLSKKSEKRVRLALCWYERSIHTSSGIEAFLNLWIGLEVIVKCRSGAHGALGIKNLLMSHYSLSSQLEVDAQFHVQSLYDRRNEMVHGGVFDEVCPFAVDFTGLLFRDIVREVLGLAPREYAREALRRSSAAFVDWSTLWYRDGEVPTTGPDMELTFEEILTFGEAPPNA